MGTRGSVGPSIVCGPQIAMLPLSYHDARPADGYLTVGFPLTFLSDLQNMACGVILPDGTVGDRCRPEFNLGTCSSISGPPDLRLGRSIRLSRAPSEASVAIRQERQQIAEPDDGGGDGEAAQAATLRSAAGMNGSRQFDRHVSDLLRSLTSSGDRLAYRGPSRAFDANPPTQARAVGIEEVSPKDCRKTA